MIIYGKHFLSAKYKCFQTVKMTLTQHFEIEMYNLIYWYMEAVGEILSNKVNSYSKL